LSLFRILLVPRENTAQNPSSPTGCVHTDLVAARILAYAWAGMRIAASILRPSVVDFLQLSVAGRESEVDLEEIKISRKSGGGDDRRRCGTEQSAPADRGDEA
jgi:hypothetical protein